MHIIHSSFCLNVVQYIPPAHDDKEGALLHHICVVLFKTTHDFFCINPLFVYNQRTTFHVRHNHMHMHLAEIYPAVTDEKPS